MKTLKFMRASLILLAGVFASCSSGPQVEAADRVEIDGLDDLLSFPYDPSEEDVVSFTISSNKTWSIAKNGLDWLTVSQINGGSKLPATVYLSATANDDLERNGELLIYAGASVQSIAVRQEAFPIVPTLTLDGLIDNTIAFEFSDISPITFTLYSNVAWTATPKELEWAEVSPLSGERKQEVTITVTPTANSGDARNGTITFNAEGMEPVVVSVSQTAYRDEPTLTISGADENKLLLTAAPEAPVLLQVLSNRNWTISKTDLGWLTVMPETGMASADPVEVTLTAEKNSGKERSGVLTIHSDDPALDDIVITVSQEAKSNTLLAWWTLSDAAIKQYSGTDWTDKGLMHPDLPAGTTAYGQWNHVAEAPAYTTDHIISSDGNGHYAVKQVWTDDNLEFLIPVTNLVAGSQINIRFAMSGTGTAPRYWTVEYFDQGIWKATTVKTFTYSDGDIVTATYELNGTNVVTDVNEVATFVEAIISGNVRIRVRCAGGSYRTDKKDQQAKPNSKGTFRIRQWSTGDNDAISFYLITQ